MKQEIEITKYLPKKELPKDKSGFKIKGELFNKKLEYKNASGIMAIESVDFRRENIGGVKEIVWKDEEISKQLKVAIDAEYKKNGGDVTGFIVKVVKK